ncbi:hypothetical protein, partial [Pseudomonas indica]|uniref:hypothetical protein n=1 Tax=Pseudomonas indica TaxID=137658 RepID=UPI003FCF6FFB
MTADNSEITATIGYGLDIDRYGTWSEVRQLIVFGLGGQDNLSQTQLQGLELLSQYKSGASPWTAENIASMARGEVSPTGLWTQLQSDALASLSFTEAQADSVLRAITFGNVEAGVSEQRSVMGDVRRLVNNNYDIAEPFPVSTELASMIIMRFRGDFTGFGNPDNIFTSSGYATPGARRAEFWWRIINKINSVGAGMGGLVTRLELNARMFGAFSSDAGEDNVRPVLEAVSHLFRVRLSSGLSANTNDTIRSNFSAVLSAGIDLLRFCTKSTVVSTAACKPA